MDENEKCGIKQSNIISNRDDQSSKQEINAACKDESHSESIEFVQLTSNESQKIVTPSYVSQINGPPRNVYPSYVVDSADLIQNLSGTQYTTDSSSESEKHISKPLPTNQSGAKSEQPNYSASERRSTPKSKESEKLVSNPPPFSNVGSIEPTSANLVQESISQCSNASNKLFIDLSEEAQSSKTLNPKKKLTKIHLPRLRSMMKKDPEVRLVSKEAVVVLAKATELFIEELCKDAMKNTLQSTTRRKTLQRKDLGLMLGTIPVLAVPVMTEEKTGEGSSLVSPFSQDKQTDSEAVVGVSSCSKEQQTYTNAADSLVANQSYKVVPIPLSKELQSDTKPMTAMTSFDDKSVKTTKPFKDFQTNFKSDDNEAFGKQLQSARNRPLSNDLQTSSESLKATPFSKEMTIGTTAMVSMPFSKDLQSDFSPTLAMFCNKELQTDVVTDKTKPFSENYSMTKTH
ncbi:POLE4 [Mytilus edulis]|uniref:POLE4 n=1 Tax=Mytilus edulis TaxID=6550 RepID=A0A8S3T9D0_MYTED|nr:POLE4 [Mytilus edulis]